MAGNQTITVKEADGTTETDVEILGMGRQAVAASKSVGLSTEDKAALDLVTTTIAGTVAHSDVDAGNASKIGFKAKSGLSGITLVSVDDRTDSYAGLDGSLYVRTIPLPDIVSGNASTTADTSTTCIAASGDAAIKTYLSKVILTNMHASTVAYVEVKSGTTVKATLPCPPGGSICSFDPPLPPNAANEVWAFDPSAAVTTIHCTMVGFKSKV